MKPKTAKQWFYSTSFHSNLPSQQPVQPPAPADHWECVEQWDAKSGKWVTVVYKLNPDGSFEIREGDEE